MRLIVITQGVSRIVEPLLASRHNIVGVLEAATRSCLTSGEDVALIKRRRSRRTSLQEFCAKHEIEYRFLASCSDDGLKEWISDKRCDLMVVFGMSALLSKDIYSMPKCGTINLHPSMLPAYRGPNPDFWQYYDMEQNPGVTIHYIDEGEDTGPILAQQRVVVELGMKSPDRLDLLVGKVGVYLLLETIARIEKGDIAAILQPKISPTLRARNLRSTEHGNIIDWMSWPIQRVWNLLRGTESWLNAIPQPGGLYASLRWSIQDFDFVSTGIQPGRLGRAGLRRFVSCRDGRIFLACRPTLPVLLKVHARRIFMFLLLRKKT